MSSPNIPEILDNFESKVKEIAQLTQTISSSELFRDQYSLCLDNLGSLHLKFVNVFAHSILESYLNTVRSLTKDLQVQSTKHDRTLQEKDLEIKLRDNEIKFKDLLTQDKDLVTHEKDLLIQEKDLLIQEKDIRLKEKDSQLNDKNDMLGKLKGHWGSVTRAQAWDLIQNEQVIKLQSPFEITGTDVERRDSLESKFNSLKANWTEEVHMYGDIVGAIQSGLYEDQEEVCVVDNHTTTYSGASISISKFSDHRLPYYTQYFLELKPPNHDPVDTKQNCGEILDRLYAARMKQPYRSEFVGVLSNFTHAFVFIASFDEDEFAIKWFPHCSLSDALVYADTVSRSQTKMILPTTDGKINPEFSVVGVGRRHLLFSVTVNESLALSTNMVLDRKDNLSPWAEPIRHRENLGKFVLKMAYGENSLTEEIEILRKIRDASCPHLPELVWTYDIDKQLGIVPIGEPVRPGQSGDISRDIIDGLIKGLKYLHGLKIVHRDIRVSNLILHYARDGRYLVIIDFKAAYDMACNRAVEYLGGHICWPRRLLLTQNSSMEKYTPQPQDDLFASILVVFHLLFPNRFENFNVEKIEPADERSEETQKLLDTWKSIEESSIWGRFYRAAEQCGYDELVNMADFFCHEV